MQRQIPTALAFGILIAVVIVAGGAILTYQSLVFGNNPALSPSLSQNSKAETITYEELANASYDVSAEGLYFTAGMFEPKASGYDPHSVKLVNGVYGVGPEHNVYPSNCTSEVSHSISIAEGESGGPLYAVGDLNSDGKDDAVVVLNMAYKETGRNGPHDYCFSANQESSELMFVVLLNKDGKIKQTDSYMNRGVSRAFKPSDISGIKIKDGIINLFGSALNLFYKLVDGKLVIANQIFTAPGLSPNLKEYTNTDFGFSFKYPQELYFQVLNPRAPVLFSIAWGTESSKRFIVSVSSNDFYTCINDLDEPHDLATELKINGITFYKTGGGDAAMGTYRNAMQYSAFYNNKCYQIYLNYFTHNCDNYLPLEPGNADQVIAYNNCFENNKVAQALSDYLDIIASTFKFTQ